MTILMAGRLRDACSKHPSIISFGSIMTAMQLANKAVIMKAKTIRHLRKSSPHQSTVGDPRSEELTAHSMSVAHARTYPIRCCSIARKIYASKKIWPFLVQPRGSRVSRSGNLTVDARSKWIKLEISDTHCLVTHTNI